MYLINEETMLEYRHPLNFVVNVDIGDPANIKTAKILTYPSPCSWAGLPATNIKFYT